MEELEKILQLTITEGLYQVILSNPRSPEGTGKIKIRPVIIRDTVLFQETAYVNAQVHHRNWDKPAVIERIRECLEKEFWQGEITTQEDRVTILVSRKGRMTIKRSPQKGGTGSRIDLAHNRMKRYILEEGTLHPFLVDLGVQTREGQIIRAKYDKFKQINRYLELIRDILPTLPKDRTINVVDFGCGKSYLTFALYYYLHEMHKLPVNAVGLDLKADVISHCRSLAARYGYTGLHFMQGDIAQFDDMNQVDLVVTLHACDTATDYALNKAVDWGAKVILAVPCCQHEVNGQIRCKELAPALKYGLIKERMAALLTDAVRAGLLEEQGYDTQVLEFIDMEHTPKNILIRAVKKEAGGGASTQTGEMAAFLNIETTLQKLLGARSKV